MAVETLNEAVSLGQRLKHVFVATTDPEGNPHVAAAGTISLVDEDRVAVSSWFCPGTVTNLEHNRRVSLVVWDAANDHGYQIVGEVETLTDMSFADGYSPEIEESMPPPQVEREIVVRVERIMVFSHAPHSDQDV